MEEFDEYLRVRQPRTFWLEQVPGFNKTLASLGASPLELFSEQCQKRGYHLRAMQIDHRIFVKVVRCRLFVWGCSDEAGGQAGADFVYELVQAMIEQILDTHPDLNVFDVVDVDSPDQQRRRDDCLVPRCLLPIS